MSARAWRFFGVVLIVAGLASVVLCAVAFGAGVKQGTGVNAALNKDFTRVSRDHYECKGTVQETANQIAAKKTPAARQFDSATGTEYLRYNKEIVTVSTDSSGKCQVRVEDLRRFNNGSLIYLGPGFSPSSPRNSSGGSSGSGSGSGGDFNGGSGGSS